MYIFLCHYEDSYWVSTICKQCTRGWGYQCAHGTGILLLGYRTEIVFRYRQAHKPIVLGELCFGKTCSHRRQAEVFLSLSVSLKGTERKDLKDVVADWVTRTRERSEKWEWICQKKKKRCNLVITSVMFLPPWRLFFSFSFLTSLSHFCFKGKKKKMESESMADNNGEW